MLKRRNFLKETTVAGIGGLLLPGKSLAAFFNKPVARLLGVQLFTFFDVIDTDVKGTLQKVADIGYKEIESAFSKKVGYYGMKPKEFRSMLNDMGLSWISHHVLGAPFKLPAGAKMPTGADGKPISIPPMRNLRDNNQELVDEAVEGGVKYLVCSSTPITTLDEVKASAAILNKTGEACKKAGIQFLYHNHDTEFHEVGGTVPYELFLSQTSAAMVKMELDLGWATKGGKDPVELFKQHPGRFPLWHVKDLDAKHENVLPAGSGTIDFKKIFDAGTTAGVQHYFVEHDKPADPFASITISYDYLSKLIKA